MRPARIAIVGIGNIARIHLAALRSLDGQAEITACADIDASRLADFCAEHGIGRRWPDLAGLLRAGRPARRHSAACGPGSRCWPRSHRC